VKSIFDYFDYRIFLNDFYVDKKSQRTSFSYQSLANKAGFKSKGYIKDVIDGKKNLSEESVFALGRALEFTDEEFNYFKNLVYFNQARTNAQREHFFKFLIDLKNPGEAKLIIAEQYSFYSKWYHNTIRELVTYFDFKGDYALLGRQLTPQITQREARASVELLLKLGLLEYDGCKYIQTNPVITTGDTVTSLSIGNFHLENLKLAADSINTCISEERDISCVIGSMTESQFKAVKKEIQLFRNKIITLLNETESDTTIKKRVYTIAFQLFPNTK
jgi:uncharacterized protein (TIGR02147 family)